MTIIVFNYTNYINNIIVGNTRMKKYVSIYKEQSLKEAPRRKKNDLKEGFPFFKFEHELIHTNSSKQSLNKLINVEYVYDGNNRYSLNCYITDTQGKTITEETTEEETVHTQHGTSGLAGFKWDKFIFKKELNRLNNFKGDVDYTELKEVYETKNLRKLEIFINKLEIKNKVSPRQELYFYITYNSQINMENKFGKIDVRYLYESGKIKSFIM